MALGIIKERTENNNRLMKCYRQIKQRKGSGNAIIAIARKLATIVWMLLTEHKEYDNAVMNDPLSFVWLKQRGMKHFQRFQPDVVRKKL